MERRARPPRRQPPSAGDNGAAKPAVAVSAPTRKAGLWEQTMHMGQMTQTTKMCLDELTEQKMKWWATEGRAEKGENPCSEQAVTPKLGGGWTFHSVCKMGESGTITSNGEATGDFGSHYTVKITSVTAGSSMPQANGTHEMTMEGTWKGACPAGMKGGDIQLANGMTFNPADSAHMGGMTGHEAGRPNRLPHRHRQAPRPGPRNGQGRPPGAGSGRTQRVRFLPLIPANAGTQMGWLESRLYGLGVLPTVASQLGDLGPGIRRDERHLRAGA